VLSYDAFQKLVLGLSRVRCFGNSFLFRIARRKDKKISFAHSKPKSMHNFLFGCAHHFFVPLKIADVHEVKYDPSKSKKKSGTYKVCLESFGSGTPEQWLKFKAKLNIVTTGNGLTEDGPMCFNVTHFSLIDEALWVFKDT